MLWFESETVRVLVVLCAILRLTISLPTKQDANCDCGKYTEHTQYQIQILTCETIQVPFFVLANPI